MAPSSATAVISSPCSSSDPFNCIAMGCTINEEIAGAAASETAAPTVIEKSADRRPRGIAFANDAISIGLLLGYGRGIPRRHSDYVLLGPAGASQRNGSPADKRKQG